MENVLSNEPRLILWENCEFVDKGYHVAIICLAFGNVFDLISYDILITNLALYNLDKTLIKWMESCKPISKQGVISEQRWYRGILQDLVPAWH